MDPTDRIAVLRGETLSLTQERMIRERWKYWHPWALLYARQRLTSSAHRFNPSYSEIDRMKLIHRRTIATCLERGLRWEIIKRHRLDDPRLDDATRERKISDAVLRNKKRRTVHADRT